MSLPGSNLFVNNLPPSVNDEALRALFLPGDIVSAKVMVDYNTGQSKGFGFVKFSSPEEASQALLRVNGFTLEDRQLQVKVAQNNYDGGHTAQGLGTPSDNIYIKNLPLTFSEEQLKQLFSPYGRIKECRVLVDPTTLMSRGLAFVRYNTIEEATNAINSVNGYTIPSTVKPLVVKFADTPEEAAMRKTKINRPQRFQGNPGGPSAAPMGGMNFMGLPGFPVPGPSGLPGFPGLVNPGMSGMSGMFGVPPSVPTGPTNPNDQSNLFVYNLPSNADDSLLYKLFSPYGGISSVKVMKDSSGQSKGFGFVRYNSVSDAVSAQMSLNGTRVGDRAISVSFKK